MDEDNKLADEDVVENTEDPLQSFKRKTLDLQEKQQALKAMLAQDEQSNRLLFESLTQSRKKLFSLQLKQYNQETSTVDLGVWLELAELHSEIEGQEKKIEALQDELRKQGLTSLNNNRQFIELKQKLTDIERQIAFGKKFIATQYFRHYFELPQAYKISYEDVKLDYERKLKVKEGLEGQKIRYQEKRKQLTKQIQDRRNDYQELTRELERLTS